jgi:hypothetical protein
MKIGDLSSFLVVEEEDFLDYEEEDLRRSVGPEPR